MPCTTSCSRPRKRTSPSDRSSSGPQSSRSDPPQTSRRRSPNNSILDNCHVRLTYGANDDKTARRISDLLGQATEKKTQRSYSGSGLWLTSRTESEQEYARPLLTAAEVNQLPQDDGILLVGGLLPYRAKKVRYFLDPRLRDRSGHAPPTAPRTRSVSFSGTSRATGTRSPPPLPCRRPLRFPRRRIPCRRLRPRRPRPLRRLRPRRPRPLRRLRPRPTPTTPNTSRWTTKRCYPYDGHGLNPARLGRRRGSRTPRRRA